MIERRSFLLYSKEHQTLLKREDRITIQFVSLYPFERLLTLSIQEALTLGNDTHLYGF